jgi:hypothetical protein
MLGVYFSTLDFFYSDGNKLLRRPPDQTFPPSVSYLNSGSLTISLSVELNDAPQSDGDLRSVVRKKIQGSVGLITLVVSPLFLLLSQSYFLNTLTKWYMFCVHFVTSSFLF